MLRKNGDNQREPVLIDFGKSMYNPQFSGDYDWGKGPYAETGLPWEFDGYVPDQNIISRIKWSQIISETQEEIFKREKEEYLLQGTQLFRYCKQYFSQIKAQLWLALDTPPQVKFIPVSPERYLERIVEYMTLSIGKWGTKGFEALVRSYSWGSEPIPLNCKEENWIYTLLTTAKTEQDLLQLLISLPKQQFDQLYDELEKRLVNLGRAPKQKVYLEYFLSFLKVLAPGFSEQEI